MRSYEKTHPWINFSMRFDRKEARLWLALGEARSKCSHLAGVPLKPKIAQALHAVYMAKGVHATAAIEGNTLSEKQVLERVQTRTAVVPESQKYLQTEVDNVIAVTNRIMDNVEDFGALPITVQTIKEYNQSILEGLEVDEHVVPGAFRRTTVGVMDYRAPSPEDCDYLMERLCDWLNGDDFKPARDDEVVVIGTIKSIIAHVYLAWIHPFGDGNGRTARALEVRFLMEAGVPSPAIHLLSNHYNLTRSEYYRRLQEASRNGGDLTNFVTYAVNGFVDQLRQQLVAVRAQQWGVAWLNYIYETFGQKKSVADKRQIALVLALSQNDAYTPIKEVKRLTVDLATAYANKTNKTLIRDLNNLEALGLVDRRPEGVRACKEMILAFLPRMKRGGLESFIPQGLKMSEQEDSLTTANLLTAA